MSTLTSHSSSSVSLVLRFAIVALAMHGAFDLARSVLAQEEHAAYLPCASQPGTMEERITALEYKLANVVTSSDAMTLSGANLRVVGGTCATDGVTSGLGNLIVGCNEMRTDDEVPGTDDANDRSG